MKTQELNLVSSPTVARLEKLEISGFLTPAPVGVAQRNAITRSSRNSAFCILNSLVANEATRLILSLCALPVALLRNHHDSPQPTASWTAVALYRFPIWCNPPTLSKAHPQPPLILCVFAPLREAFLSRFKPGKTFLGSWWLEISPPYRLNGRLSPQRQVVPPKIYFL
jgi:hypothetical protein